MKLGTWIPVLGFFLVGGYAQAAVEFKEAEITTIKNMVEHDPGSGAAPARVNEKIFEKSTVSTAAASMAELTFTDSSITRMGSNTQFSFRSKERLVKLDQGTILIHTPPGNGGAKVEAGGVTAAVTGTTFMASRDGVGNVMFVLLEGQGGLKVTVGGATTVIRPGQAASVGADSIPEPAKGASDAPGGGAQAESKTAAPRSDDAPGAGGGTGGGAGGGTTPTADAPAPAPAKPVEIKVFEVDVKKVIATTPLVTEFKTELPSSKKIDATIEVQQTKLQEGKLEKLEVEVVAVAREDGDLLIGAPKVEKEEMKVVNSKETVAEKGPGGSRLDVDTAAGGNNLDIETAAGPGPGTVAAAPPPAKEPAGPAVPAAVTPPAGSAGQIVTGTALVVRPEPTELALTFSGNRGTVTLNREAVQARTVLLNLPGLAPVVIPAGSQSASFTFDPRTVFTPSTTAATFTASSGNLTATATAAGIFADPSVQAAVTAANPIRDFLEANHRTFFNWTADPLAEAYELDLGGGKTIRLTGNSYEADGTYASAILRKTGMGAVTPETLSGVVSGVGMSAAELAGFDNFFYFTTKAAGVTGGPSAFFADAPAERTLATRGIPVNLGSSSQNYELYTAQLWKAGTAPAISGGMAEKIFYGDRIDFITPGAQWGSLSSWDGTAPPVGASDTLWSNFFGRMQDGPAASGLVWDDQGGVLGSAAHIYPSGVASLIMAAGDGGIQVRGTGLATFQSSVEFTTSGDLEMSAANLSGIGAPTVTAGSAQKSGELTLEAAGKVKLGAQTVAGVAPTKSEAAAQQVRLAAVNTASGGGAPSMAVIRTGNSLELRNVVIRDFSGAKLEKMTQNSDGTSTLNGRVLMSGSAVRDFKIRELVGAAVNADAKIQMMAMDAGGALAGEMMVEGQLPVATKLAGAIASLGAGDAPAATPVHASLVDLAAKTVNFNNATLTAMNSITARANTVIVQNSFLTVVRGSGMINMYVREGAVNLNYGTVRDGFANFAGLNTFQIGSMAFNINNQDGLNQAYGTKLFDVQNSSGAVPGAVNVLKL